ncbi:hypothetical protein [Azospirillum sp. Sh1]|uniref:hypothetical protein n=1 Tax=Azospirillum sp. Sh1 TaxID=2607285 RepID=UPI001B3B5BFE|nr:hypothetical protein [Azospirillum sp. Sh1]
MIKKIFLDRLLVNQANDRHGELESEAAAIAWLFMENKIHMKNLAKDIAQEEGLFELPLVFPYKEKFIVFDGNRRITCLKLIKEPVKAPDKSLQEFFFSLKEICSEDFLREVECQVEDDRDKIDEIIYRRHTGTQKGVGRSRWDGRMRDNFISRTGRNVGLNVADEIEKRLQEAGMLPDNKIPRTNMNRLLSAETFRNRVGFTVKKGRFSFTRDENATLKALFRIANDLSGKNLVLGGIWDERGKRSYLDRLEREGILPNIEGANAGDGAESRNSTVVIGRKDPAAQLRKPVVAIRKSQRKTLIPNKEYGIMWSGDLQRHHKIWEELQFDLEFPRHSNAISVLFRVLLELTIDSYVKRTGIPVYDGDNLAKRVVKVASSLKDKGKIDRKYMEMINKFQNYEQLLSADTLNRYIHSPNFAPSPEHLMSLWDSLSELVVCCLKA